MELVKNHFSEEHERDTHTFTHPQSLGERELSKLRQLLPRWDRFGSDLNIHEHLDRTSSRGSRNSSIPASPPGQATTLPTIAEPKVGFGETPTPPSRTGFSGLRQRFFGRSESSRDKQDEGDRLESGQSPSNPNLLSPTSTLRQGDSSRSQLDLTRTETMSRTIRFAEHATNDSDTAPGPQGSGNYGNNQPGFRKTPGLAMFRTTSVKSQEGG